MKQVYLCPSLTNVNFVLVTTFLVTSSTLSKLFQWLTSLRAPEKWKSEGAKCGLGGWGTTAHPSFDCFLCFQTCAWSCVAMLQEGFSSIFVKLTFLQHFFRVLWVQFIQIWLNGLILWHNVYQSHPFCIPMKQWPWLAFWRGNIKLVLPRRHWMMPFHWLSFHPIQSDCSLFHPHCT